MAADLADELGLAHCRVLITGGAAGIGRAIAEKFLEAGARVGICDIDSEALTSVEATHTELLVARCDVADSDQVAELFAVVEREWSGLDVLVNNAGIGGGAASIEEIENEAWQRAIDVNLSGMFYCLRAAVPGMKAKQSGVIINISTATVHTGLPERTPYVASKHGVMGLTQNAARELGPYNIRCNAILPGLVDNARGRGLISQRAEAQGVPIEVIEAEYLKFVSMRCWIDPAEVGNLAVFLASDWAKHISGQFIAVDGNMEWES